MSEDQQSFGLLLACVNKDLEMLKYLWENLGSYIYSLSNFECMMR